METSMVTKLEKHIRGCLGQKGTRDSILGIMREMGKSDRQYEDITEMLIKGRSEETEEFLKNMTDGGFPNLAIDLENLWSLRKGGISRMDERKKTRTTVEQTEIEQMSRLVRQLTETQIKETQTREEQHLKELKEMKDFFKQELAERDENHRKEIINLLTEAGKKNEEVLERIQKETKAEIARLYTQMIRFKEDITHGLRKFMEFKVETESSYEVLHSSAEETEHEALLSEMRKESDEYKSKSDELEKRYKDLQEKVAKESGEISAKSLALEKERDDLQKKLIEERTEKDRIEESYKNLRCEKNNLEKELYDLKAKHDALLTKLQSGRAGMYLQYKIKFLH